MDKQLALRPRLSEKAYGQSTEGVYVFMVPANANKHTVASAVAAQFDVEVASVNMINVKGKTKRTVYQGGRRSKAGSRSDFKKAYVTLASGQSIPIFAAEEEAEAKQEKVQAEVEKASAKQAEKDAKEAAKKAKKEKK
ncbi:50S ribosomal protein L23 [Candidatus Saccharibacteria bacterium]|nr:50S ribosomal protein L23 [Candidatus Saccharibacteria bacterium]